MATKTTKQSKKRLGIVGAGRIAQRHARALQKISAVEIAAWSASKPANAQRVAAELGGTAMATKELLCAADIDAVLICTPTFLHHQQTLSALAHGKKVFCEKPFARTLEQADEMIAKGDGQIYVGHVLRFFHAYNRARQIVQRDDLGAVRKVTCRRLGKKQTGSAHWLQDVEKSGGVLLDLVIHDFDWLLWTFGEPAALRVETEEEKDKNGWQHAIAHIGWQHGLRAEVEGSWLNDASEIQLVVEGERGTLRVDSSSPGEELLLETEDYQRTISLEGLPDPYVMQMKHFAGWLNGLLEPIVTVQEARAALALSLRAIAARK